MTHFSVKHGKRSDILNFYKDSNESAEDISNKIISIVAENGLSLSNLITTLMQDKDKNQCCKLWVSFFEKATVPMLIIMRHVLAIPVNNELVGRVLSVVNGLWTDDMNRMSTELVKAEICIKMNLSVSCQDFYKIALGNKRFLESVRSTRNTDFKEGLRLFLISKDLIIAEF